MFRKSARMAMFVLTGMSTCVMAGSVSMNPGLWEWTATVEMPGTPVQLPPSSYSGCLTAADFVPKDSKLGETCETIDLQTNGNTVSWNMTCTTPQGVVTSQGKITYSGDTATGDIQLNTMGMQMVSRTTGRRIGPCK